MSTNPIGTNIQNDTTEVLKLQSHHVDWIIVNIENCIAINKDAIAGAQAFLKASALATAEATDVIKVREQMQERVKRSTANIKDFKKLLLNIKMQRGK